MIEMVFPKSEDAEVIQNVFYKSWLDTYPNEEVMELEIKTEHR